MMSISTYRFEPLPPHVLLHQGIPPTLQTFLHPTQLVKQIQNW